MLFWDITLRLFEGLAYTLTIFGVTLLAAIPLGLLISFGSKSTFKPLNAVVRGFIWIIRGTPLMLQIMFFFLAPSVISKTFQIDWYVRGRFDMLLTVCVAFIINYACYFSEIFRGGIQSIPNGQYEASQVLGLTKSQTFFKVILLQVVKRIIPPMSNEIITLVKDTALASVLINVDLFSVAKEISNAEVEIWPLFYAGLFYLIFNGLLTILIGKAEKKLSYFKVQ